MALPRRVVVVVTDWVMVFVTVAATHNPARAAALGEERPWAFSDWFFGLFGRASSRLD